jgi:hypothetical protein
MRAQTTSPLPASTRVLLSFLVPLMALFLVNSFIPDNTSAALAAAVITSWLLGLRWYGIRGMGLRGHRPLYAGIGFAVLGWLAFLFARYVTVDVAKYVDTGLGRVFIYLLFYEAFAVQLWTFGLFFHTVADWRGPLTAAVSSGFLFGAVAYLFFQESFIASPGAILYFAIWGILYGLIRLRTGSLLGIAIIQAMHSLTAWQLLKPPDPPAANQLWNLYLLSSLLYIVLIWRLWPKRQEDYRV